MSSTYSRICSSCAAFRPISVQITAPSSLRPRSENGLRPSELRPLTSSRAVSLGEWLRRELQRQAPRRAAQRGDLLQPQGGTDHNRDMAASLQHQTPALLARVSTARSRGRAWAGLASFFGRSASHTNDGARRAVKLTFTPRPLSGGRSVSRPYLLVDPYPRAALYRGERLGLRA